MPAKLYAEELEGAAAPPPVQGVCDVQSAMLRSECI